MLRQAINQHVRFTIPMGYY